MKKLSVLIIALMAASAPAFANPVLDALLPCAQKMKMAVEGKGGDPTPQELDKCYQDANKIASDVTRDLSLLLIGRLSMNYDQYVENAQQNAEAASLPQISATELVSAFKNNELSANNQFKDKEIVVSGEITKIGVNLGKVSISLKGDKFGMQNVQAFITKDQEERAGKLSKGQTVKIKGVCDGISFVNVALTDAVIL